MEVKDHVCEMSVKRLFESREREVVNTPSCAIWMTWKSDLKCWKTTGCGKSTESF